MPEKTGDENQGNCHLFDIVCIQLQIHNTTHTKEKKCDLQIEVLDFR